MKFPKIVIVDYGSQYTLLIAKAVRKLRVYSEIIPESRLMETLKSDPDQILGIILSGGPKSVVKTKPDLEKEPYRSLLSSDFPILGICYGAQLLAFLLGANIVQNSDQREYGKTYIYPTHLALDDSIYHRVPMFRQQVWMSHSDLIEIFDDQSNHIQIISETEGPKQTPAIFKINNRKWYGLQFHPEVTHTSFGLIFLENFVISICGAPQTWNSQNFLKQIIPQLQKNLKNHKVMVACSGGVDSTVTAMILQKAIGDNFVGIFVDNGLLRKDEYQQVMEFYKKMGLHVVGFNARDQFYIALKGIKDPEKKRKVIGGLFISIFKQFAPKVEYLGQGTIYPDVIESHGKIKSHHNVGGLPKELNLKLVEPLRELLKNEVRQIGKELGLNPLILNRHPFPGPGLAIRILGDVTQEKVMMLQEADHIFIEALKNTRNQDKTQSLYDSVWQAGVILTDSLSVGVMGDNRTYQSVVVLRAVTSVNGMTAGVSNLSMEFLTGVATKIVNQVPGINRVVYDITTKPPGTIEWE